MSLNLRRDLLRLLAVLLALTSCAVTQPVHLQVDAGHPTGTYKPVWNFFGADEPNYTYAPNGTKLLSELSAIDPATPVYFRPHNLLTSGDGSASLKWGSTGVYREDAQGKPVYDWTITDQLFDNLAATHVRPLVEIGFMPEALSPHPQPYRHSFHKSGDDIFTGWSYPPADYAKWRALIVAWVEHLHNRYGAAVNTWLWEVWNEPDIAYFHGTERDYEKLYDVTAGALRQVLPKARIGGPGVTGPYPQADPSKNNPFLHDFLEHAAHGIDADTGKPGVPLDFISFHPKGEPKFIAAAGGAPAHVRMNLARQMAATDLGMQIVASFPEFRATPIILTETDPEGCAACRGPQMGYRNGTLYGVSVAEMLVRSATLAQTRGVNLLGAVTWAFEFEEPSAAPWFAGYRELATNGVDKPVLNVFRLFGHLHGQLLPLSSDAALTDQALIAQGVSGAPDVDGIATRAARSIDVVVWNYHDEDLPANPVDALLEVSGIPAHRVQVTQTRVDADHANSYAGWLTMGSPQHPSAGQIRLLQDASRLVAEDLGSLAVKGGTASFQVSLPRQAVVLVHLAW